jgi:phosphate transport system substrate-binding protein
MRKMSTYAVLCVLLLFAACADVKAGNEAKITTAQANEPNDANSVQKIVISGTGDSQDIIEAIAATLEKKLGGVEIQVPDSIGSSGGIKAVINGEIDLARVARPLKKTEEELGLTCKVFAKTPVVFVVHPDVTGVDNITEEEIIGIYSGNIINWNMIGGEPGKIYPLTREPGDSSMQVFNEMLPGFANITNPVAKVVYTTHEVVTALSEHAKTIGFTSLSAVIGTRLKVLKFNGVYPSAENVASGKYRLVLPLGIVYKEQPKGLAAKFVDFLYSEEGQKIITSMGAVPVK